MRQHLIPNCYLKVWCDPRTPEDQTPYIWRISKDGSKKKNKAPQQSFTATDRYTITLPTGEKDLIVENTLAGLENAFISVRGRIEGKEELRQEDRATLAMCSRKSPASQQSRRPRPSALYRSTFARSTSYGSAPERPPGTLGKRSGYCMTPSAKFSRTDETCGRFGL